MDGFGERKPALSVSKGPSTSLRYAQDERGSDHPFTLSVGLLRPESKGPRPESGT